MLRGLFYVEYFAAERQYGLGLAVAAVLGGAACGITLYDEDLGQRRVLFGAVGKLAGKAGAFQDALSYGIAGFSGSFSGAESP